MKKKIGIACLALLLLSGCGVKLANGENAVVTFNDGAISSQDYYDLLKEKYGVSDLVDLIDTTLLEKEYDEDATEKEYINNYVSSIKANTGEENFLTTIKQYYNLNSEKEFREYIRLNYRRTNWAEEYAKTTVNEKQINEYYEEVAIGDITASHILISSDATDDMTSEEKTKAEEEALKLAKDIIKKLDNGEDFATLAKEHSDDTGTSADGGVLPAFNTFSNYDENFLQAAIELESGKYSKTPVKSQFGYHIIYKKSQAEKPSLDEIKDDIIEVVADEMIENDSTIYGKAIANLREKYEMKIEDAKLNSLFEEYMSYYK